LSKEPDVKKIKLNTASVAESKGASTEDDKTEDEMGSTVDLASPSSDEWVEIDKASIPHKVTVEDAPEDGGY
jgi:hypothetical protein